MKEQTVNIEGPRVAADGVGRPLGGQVPEGCRWIYGEPALDLAGWRYCGRPRGRPGSSWCPGHRAIAVECGP